MTPRCLHTTSPEIPAESGSDYPVHCYFRAVELRRSINSVAGSVEEEAAAPMPVVACKALTAGAKAAPSKSG
jgi:hypothetical protein